MEAPAEQQLGTMYQTKQAVAVELVGGSDLLKGFVDPANNLIKRVASSSSRRETQLTCTAFCLYYLLGRQLVGPDTAGGSPQVISKAEAALLAKALGGGIVRGHPPAKGGGRKFATATGSLPNQYNSSLWIAGYLRTSRTLNLSVPNDVSDACERVVKWLANLIKRHDGFVPRIEVPRAPSSYLTFWAAAAIHEWLSSLSLGFIGGDISTQSTAQQSQDSILRWSEHEVANSIAHHHSGIRSQFDVISLFYSILAVLHIGPRRETLEQVKHGLEILFGHYFGDGCFGPSAPVLADRHNFSLQCPTAEVSALALMIRPDLMATHWQALSAVYEWLRDNRQADTGWYPENVGRYSEPTSFMTASALAFFAGFEDLLDDELHRRAAQAFELLPFSANPQLAKINYPESLQPLIAQHVVEPIIGKNPRLASYSLILYGPPGTSKTTIARKIAQDLQWPLLILNQSSFLRRGIQNIDGEAERLFRFVGYLKNVTVLFDEVEELVQDRDTADRLSRMLTTSMLPRIAELRDQERVVFIFATNRVETIDEAAKRFGRFDIIRAILPPEKDERKTILDGLLCRFNASDDLKRIIESMNILDLTEDFCYGHLEAFIKYIQVETQIGGHCLDNYLVDKALRSCKRGIDDPDSRAKLKGFKDRSLDIDRP